MRVLVIATLFALVALTAPAEAQILYGGMVGTVLDQTGAAVPTAAITLVNVESGATRTAVSSGGGAYQFSTLVPGNYKLSVHATGFKLYAQTGIDVAAEAAVRVDVKLQVGEASEQITVEAGATTVQTESAEVKRTIQSEALENIPVNLSRNYESLLVTVPGISPPQDGGSFAANPSGSLTYSANGATNQSNNVRIDGASSFNTNQPQYTAINPTLESIAVVDVVTGAMDAEQGLAGGAAIHLQMKSGANSIHGSAFWYHNNQHFDAYPYFSDHTSPKPKYISNHPGGTIGGPIKKNRAFYFVSYEEARDNSNAQAFFTVPTALMRAGNLAASPIAVYDPATGKPYGTVASNLFASDRTPFPGNQIPLSRISPVSQRILALPDWPAPNRAGGGALGLTNDYIASGQYWTRRDQVDSKVNFNLTEKWTAFARLSYLHFDQLNPAVFGNLDGPGLNAGNTRPGTGYGQTYSGTVSTTYIVTPTFLIDGYFGNTLQQVNAGPDNLGQNFARDTLKIPGTNGTDTFSGGMVQMTLGNGFTALGYSQNSPYFSNDYLRQYAANGTWMKGKHTVRFGFETLLFDLHQLVANPVGATGGPAGAFVFNAATTSLRGGPATNAYNNVGAFLLGLAQSAGRTVTTVPELATRANANALYVADRFQMLPSLTLSYGLRWEYYPFPVRADRGLERYDFNTNQMLVCGTGSVPTDCGLSQSKRLFSPRAGIAWRTPHDFVLRAGFAISYDPYNYLKELRGNYPAQYAQNLAAPDSRGWTTTLDQGLPVAPPALQGDHLTVPLDAALITLDPSYRRSYVESWNVALERQVKSWLATASYVGTRSVDLTSLLDANYALPGTGQAGEPLVTKFGRTATTQFLGTMGAPKYDALQARLIRRGRGNMIQVSYTYANSRAYVSESSSASPKIAIPADWRLNYGPATQDLRHSFTMSSVQQLPFGKGKRWVSQGAASRILGGWQVSAIAHLHTGLPANATAPSTVLNAPGSSNTADCLGSVVKIGMPNLWWSPASFANPNVVSPLTPRFGTCGWGVLRGPGLINVDMGVTRTLRLKESLSLQIRGDAMNVSNTPHFANPTGDITNANFGVVTAVQNTGRGGLDQRIIRLGLRLGW